MSEKMNMDAAPKIVSSLVKALQVVCHGYVEFNTNVEIVGHIHINVDREQKYNYVLNECVNRGDGRSSTFVSNSFYAKPPKDVVTERDRPPEPPIESDIMAFAASQYSESDGNSRSAPMNSAAPVNHTQTYRLNKRDVQGNSVRHRPGATASSSISSSAPRVPPLHPASTDISYDPIVLDSAKRLRKSNSTDRLDESRRHAQSQRRAGSEERSRSDLPSEVSIPSTSASLSSQQPSHTAASASVSAALSDSSGDASRQAAQGLKEEEEDVVLIKEEVCEEELLRACGGPVFPGDNFSQSHPPATATSRGDTSATETSSRGQTHSSDLSGSSYLGSGADYTGASTSYAEPHDSGQSHLYPVSLHANMMNTLPGSGGMSMMSPESATTASTSTATHPAFRTTDALPGRPGNSSSVFAYGRTHQAYSSEDHGSQHASPDHPIPREELCEMVELVPGSGICLSVMELSDILQSSCRSNMKYHQQQGPSGPAMARRLLRRFFSRDQLVNATIANSPGFDKTNLDPNVINAIVGFCMQHSADSKAKIREAIFWSCSSITSRAKKQRLRTGISSENSM